MAAGNNKSDASRIRHVLRVLRPLIWWLLLLLVLYAIRTHERLMEKTRLYFTVSMQGQPVEAAAIRFDADELRQTPHAKAEYGFVRPLTLVLQQGPDRWRLLVGHRTAPGDQVYLRIAGVETVFATDAGWLKYIPRSADDWRDTALVDVNVSDFDWISITNGLQVVELRRDATTHLWRMIRPLKTRANNERIADFLRQLQAARVARFVMDDPQEDLSAFGLQPAHLDFWLGQGTNLTTALFLGMDATASASEVFGKREGWNVVFTTAAPPLSYWWAPVNAFRDPYLLELAASVAEIQVRGRDSFTLQRQAASSWRVVGEEFPVDAGTVQQFIHTLARLRVARFVKDVVTPLDYPAYGLAKPAYQITLRSTVGNTNIVTARLFFGITNTNEVFVRCAGEDSVYAISREALDQLPETGWQFRERRVWNFANREVAQINIRENGKTRLMIRNGPNQWSLGPGSQGIIIPPAVEETAYQLGHLDAAGWIARDPTNAATCGFKPGNLSITVGLKNGRHYTVDFGAALPPETALAAVTLDGQSWIFVFPPAAYQLVLSYLTIPANAP